MVNMRTGHARQEANMPNVWVFTKYCICGHGFRFSTELIQEKFHL